MRSILKKILFCLVLVILTACQNNAIIDGDTFQGIETGNPNEIPAKGIETANPSLQGQEVWIDMPETDESMHILILDEEKAQVTLYLTSRLETRNGLVFGKELRLQRVVGYSVTDYQIELESFSIGSTRTVHAVLELNHELDISDAYLNETHHDILASTYNEDAAEGSHAIYLDVRGLPKRGEIKATLLWEEEEEQMRLIGEGLFAFDEVLPHGTPLVLSIKVMNLTVVQCRLHREHHAMPKHDLTVLVNCHNNLQPSMPDLNPDSISPPEAVR